MIIKSATGLALAAACLTTIATLPAAHAQTAGTYGAPGSYGYGAAPGTYGTAPGTYNPAPDTYGTAPGTYGSTTGTYAPQTQYAPPPPPPGSTQVLTNGPQTNPGDVSPSWSAQQNVRESEHYDRLLETNPGFRQARMRKECGPITDPQLHQQCLDSFAQYEPSGAAPAYGSSTGTRSYRSYYGR
jgi:hypothetical protein